MFAPPISASLQGQKRSAFLRVVVPILLLILTTIVYSFVIFLIIDAPPEEQARRILGENADQRAVQMFITEKNIPDSMIDRYMRAVTGSFGESHSTTNQVNRLIGERFPTTILLMLVGFVWTMIFAIPIGIFAAVKQNRIVDVLSSFITILCKSMPFVVIGLLLLFWLAFSERVLPAGGAGSFSHYIMPVITLGFTFFGFAVQAVRATAIRIRENSSSGLFFQAPETGNGRTLQNTILPTIAKAGVQAGWLFGSVILVEILFAMPGVGNIFLSGVFSRDTSVMIGAAMILSLFFILAAIGFDYAIAGIIYGFRAKIRKAGTRV